MNQFKLENISKALKICLQITFIAGIFLTLFLNYILKYFFSEQIWKDQAYYQACIIILRICGIFSLNILWQLIKLFDTIQNKNPFVTNNVNCLKLIALSSFGISIMFFMLMYFRATILTFAIGYIFIIASLSCLVLAEVFRRAVEYKNENDLTV